MKTEKIKVFIFVTLLILGIVAGFYYSINSILDGIYLKNDFAYTISDKISLTFVNASGADKQYSFFLKGKWYSGHTTLSLRRDGTKYFIKFYPPNPNRNKATEVIASSEDIKNLPPDGYKKLPHK
ncbi:MAG: hypothetical protein KGM16_09195 [Bacteroidota bacterium]|nr:hypothetical protein [Bacteroidota bacterium]